ncbi:MAG: DEAD/DEAH box helicase [Planctomycetota bacterium]
MTDLDQILSALDQLKDFQRQTVEYVFERMYLAPDCTRRFLVADEVGLGKTLVARGLIAKAIDHLWDRTERIDIVYVCSNADIARQNIERLNITGQSDFQLSSRITLLPITIGHLLDGDTQPRRVNFVSFTPGTSFDLRASAGRSDERELLYWLLNEAWNLSYSKATCVFQSNADIDNFRYRVDRFREWYSIHPTIKERFVESISRTPKLREQYETIAAVLPRAHAHVPPEIHRQRNEFIGELRRLLAQTCLHWLEPDLIILDEFQRFKHLLEGDTEEACAAARLAEHLFKYQGSQDRPNSAARVLLLSATPYKMYTLTREMQQEDHYQDFRSTLDFLLPNDTDRTRLEEALDAYRNGLYRIADGGIDALLVAKSQLEQLLRRVMVRTERLALRANRDGMLTELRNDGVQVAAADIREYLAVQQIARKLGHQDVLEYWKSAPYLLNFMDEYDLKRKLKAAINAPEQEQDPEVVGALRAAQSTMLDRERLERYRRLDPANARLRALHQDTIGREAWRLLWIPPSLPYYRGSGPFAAPDLANFTKRLVFSCWRVVPKAVASILSYEAERNMVHSFRRGAKNTRDARKKRRRLLDFRFSKGRPAGMPVLGMIYPCRTLADRFDPLRDAAWQQPGEELPTLSDRVGHAEHAISELLIPLVARYAQPSAAEDESWYWAAPLLLDQEHDADHFTSWFHRDGLAKLWAGESEEDPKVADGWSRHIQHAQALLVGEYSLGRPPEDLANTLAVMALASPGIVALRALGRVVPAGAHTDISDLRDFAAPIGYAFLHLFNIPEVMCLLRDSKGGEPYWNRVLDYCAAGNLQAVLDEYVHLLVESQGMVAKPGSKIASALRDCLIRCLTLRTATAQADMLRANRERAQLEEPVRMRTRFAMRFGDADSDDGSEPTRADDVRATFNSPFWPFVLATTSIGQEGLDFHPYCHAVVHWNLPSNPVDLEQREGRVHRYKGHAVRKNIAASHADAVTIESQDPWLDMFEQARATRPEGETDLFPYWVAPNGVARIERYVPMVPHSREITRKADLYRSLVLYRMVFGQNRQEDLVDYLLTLVPPEEIDAMIERCRINLSPNAGGGCSPQGPPASLTSDETSGPPFGWGRPEKDRHSS